MVEMPQFLRLRGNGIAPLSSELLGNTSLGVLPRLMGHRSLRLWHGFGYERSRGKPLGKALVETK